MPPRKPAERRDGRQPSLRGTARERLLDAGLTELRERGYAGASLQGIARRAGLTKGAVYWNFRDKNDLFQALVNERLDAPARDLMRLTAEASPEAVTAGSVSEGLARLIREQRDLLVLLHEQWALAVREPALRAGYLERQALLRSALARTLEARHEATGVPLVYPAERLATALLALANGLAMDALVDDDAVPDDLFGDVLDLLYDGLAARAAAG